MIIERINTMMQPAGHIVHTDAHFAAVLEQYAPLFSPWPIVDQNLRANPAISGASLSAHATASNRREGRHARG